MLQGRLLPLAGPCRFLNLKLTKLSLMHVCYPVGSTATSSKPANSFPGHYHLYTLAPFQSNEAQGEAFSATTFILAAQTILLVIDERSTDDGYHSVYMESATVTEMAPGSTDPPASCLVAHRIKTEAMQLCSWTCDQTNVTEDHNFEHKCDCGRSFSHYKGLLIHQSRWCNHPGQQHQSDYKIEEVKDVRGTPDNRYYLIQWKGTNDKGEIFRGNTNQRNYFGHDNIDTPQGAAWRPTWEPAHNLGEGKIADFWLCQALIQPKHKRRRRNIAAHSVAFSLFQPRTEDSSCRLQRPCNDGPQRLKRTSCGYA